MDLTSLRLFVRVVEEGKISRAAEKEYIATAAVSHRVSELEKQLNVILLRRTNKGVEPTQAGLELLYHAKHILNNITSIKQNIKKYSQGEVGLIHILTNISASTQLLPRLLSEFSIKHPGIFFKIEEKNSLNLLHELEEGKADIGFYTELPHSIDVTSYPVFQDELVALVPKGHPLCKRQEVGFIDCLEFEHISLLSGTHINYQLNKSALAMNKALLIKATVSSYEVMCSLVNEGMGMGILPLQSTEKYHIPNTTTIKLTDSWARRRLCVAINQNRLLQPQSKKLLDFLLENRVESLII